MRIVDTDNFGGDYPDERFLLWEMPKEDAEAICKILNRRMDVNAPRFYKVVENDYVLAPGFQP